MTLIRIAAFPHHNGILAVEGALPIPTKGPQRDVLAEALDGGKDVVGGLGPLEGFGGFLMIIDEGADVGLELESGAVHPQLLAREFGEPTLDLVEPRAGLMQKGTADDRLQ